MKTEGRKWFLPSNFKPLKRRSKMNKTLNEGRYVIRPEIGNGWYGSLKDYEYAIQHTDKDLENMSDMEKLTMSIKTESMKKVLFLIEMILNPEGELGDNDYEFLKDILNSLMMRLDIGIDNLATKFAKDRTKEGLPIYS